MNFYFTNVKNLRSLCKENVKVLFKVIAIEFKGVRELFKEIWKH